MNKRSNILTIVLVAALLGTAVIVSARDDERDANGHWLTMQDSASALRAAGTAMERQGQTMLDHGRTTADRDLVAFGVRWLVDGQALAQRGAWLAMSPTDPGMLQTTPSRLSTDGSWTELQRRSQQMHYDPASARSIDLDALRQDGAAMQDEGRLMVESGRQMTDEVEQLRAGYGLAAPEAAALTAAATALVRAGEALAQDGTAMIASADQFARSLGQ